HLAGAVGEAAGAAGQGRGLALDEQVEVGQVGGAAEEAGIPGLVHAVGVGVAPVDVVASAHGDAGAAEEDGEVVVDRASGRADMAVPPLHAEGVVAGGQGQGGDVDETGVEGLVAGPAPGGRVEREGDGPRRARVDRGRRRVHVVEDLDLDDQLRRRVGHRI